MGLFVRVEGSFLEFEGGDVSMFQEGLGLKLETRKTRCLFIFCLDSALSFHHLLHSSLPTPAPHNHNPLSFLFRTLLHFPIEGSLIAHLDLSAQSWSR